VDAEGPNENTWIKPKKIRRFDGGDAHSDLYQEVRSVVDYARQKSDLDDRLNQTLDANRDQELSFEIVPDYLAKKESVVEFSQLQD